MNGLTFVKHIDERLLELGLSGYKPMLILTT